MAFLTNVKVKIVGNDDLPRNGVNVSIGNPGGSALQSAITSGCGTAMFTNLSAATYDITVSGLTTSCIVKNTVPVNPDTIPFENRTFLTSTMSGTNIQTQNYIVKNATISGNHMAPNVNSDFTGAIQTSSTVPAFYNPNTNAIVLWSGTNVGKQYNDFYMHSNQNTMMTQSTVIKMNI